MSRRRTVFRFAIVVAVCAAHAWRPSGLVGDVTYMIATVGAGVVALQAVFRRPLGSSVSWAWIAVGVACSSIGDVSYNVLLRMTDGGIVDASLADVFYFASYIAIAFGLLSMLGMHGVGRRPDVDGLIDMAAFAILSVIVIVQLADVERVFADDRVSTLVQVTWAAYPILDAALLAVLLRTILSGRRLGASGLLLSAGVGCWLAADFSTLLIADAWATSMMSDLGWMVGAALIGSAVVHAPPVAPVVRATGAGASTAVPARARHGGAQVLISLSPLVVPGAIETWAFLRGDDLNPVPLFVSTVALVVLAGLRSTRLVRSRNLHAEALERGERYYQALAENSADAVIVIDEHNRIVNETPQLAAMLGKRGMSTTGTDFVDLIRPDDPQRVCSALDRMRVMEGVVSETELWAPHTEGGPRWFAIRGVNRAQDPAVRALIVNIHDITDRKRAEEELTHRAYHDSLTGLANRAFFLERVENAVGPGAGDRSGVAVVYLDVDGFKTVNDSRGHECGDTVLREIAGRLQGSIRAGDTVARLGGDEFAILVERSTHPLAEACAVAERILVSLATPVHVDDQRIVLSASIGITVGDLTSNASSMLRDADIAMYRAKTSGKAKWTVFEPAMRAAAVERLELETDFAQALAERQFELVYQPIIDLANDRLVGFEALLRWHHPTRGLIVPDAFIPIAEDNGSIVAIGQWVLEEACRTGAAWQTRLPGRELTMAVNLSMRQIATPDIVHHVEQALRHSGLASSSLVLEMTETVLVRDPTMAAQRLHELRALGVRLAIDDFGTGYSSLSYLRQFPVDILKIDRSFVSTITDRRQVPAIVRGMLELAKTLKLEIIAEGIEHDVQRDSLRDQHCEYGQGFLFSKPLGVDDVGALLDQLAGTDLVFAAGAH